MHRSYNTWEIRVTSHTTGSESFGPHQVHHTLVRPALENQRRGGDQRKMVMLRERHEESTPPEEFGSTLLGEVEGEAIVRAHLNPHQCSC